MPTPATQDERSEVVSTVAALGWPAGEVDRVILFESRWCPDAINPVSAAAGLIQFMPYTLASMGFHPELGARERAQAMALLSASEQAPWVAAYFKGTGRKWRLPGDTYLAVAAPGFVGAPDDTVIYPVASRAWLQNPAWREVDDGPITAASIRRLIRGAGAASSPRPLALVGAGASSSEPRDLPSLSTSRRDAGELPTLHEGCNGNAVLALTILLGMPRNTNSFDAEVADRVRQFQARARLDVDGVVGPVTWGRLLVSNEVTRT